MMGMTVRMILVGLSIVMLSGCHVSFSSYDGYKFNFQGVRTDKHLKGAIEQGVTQIQVENKFGDVKVTAAGLDGPGWKWSASCWAKDEELSVSFLDQIEMDVRQDQQTQVWKLNMPEPSDDLKGIKSDLILSVPPGVSVKVVNRFGMVVAADVDSTLHVENRHGGTMLKNLTGAVECTTAHGDLNADTLAAAKFTVKHGDTTVANANGDFEFEGAHGELSAKNVTGNVKATNRHGDMSISSTGRWVSADSRHGDITLEINSQLEKLDVENAHGEIDVVLPASTQAVFSLSTSHGSAKSDINSVDGGAPVTLKNSFGDIRVKAKR